MPAGCRGARDGRARRRLGRGGSALLDASTAHRVAPGWTYGFPELEPGQAERIAAARRVANPGCYPTGAIALIRPLVDAGLIPQDYPITINAVSGYSGGGRSMIEAFESGDAPSFELYGLSLEHKHVPETQAYARLTRRPIFVPSVGNFRQGMLVSVPLHLDALPGKPSAADLEAVLAERYADCELVRVVPAAGGKRRARWSPRRSTTPTFWSCASSATRSTATRSSSPASTTSARARPAPRCRTRS